MGIWEQGWRCKWSLRGISLQTGRKSEEWCCFLTYNVLSKTSVCICIQIFSLFLCFFYPPTCFWHSQGRTKKAAFFASGANLMWNRSGRVENTWTWYSDNVGLGADSNINPSSCGRVSGRCNPLSAFVKKTVNILRLSLSSSTFNQTFLCPHMSHKASHL